MSGSHQASLKLVSYLYEPTLAARTFGRSQRVRHWLASDLCSRRSTARIIPGRTGLRFQFDVWLTYHPDAARIPRVRRMIDWLINSFDPRKYPWFRDEFIHPNDLPKEYRGTPHHINLF